MTAAVRRTGRPHPRWYRRDTPPEIAAAYGFPTDVDGTGQTVAIIELGGGFRTDDLDAYFAGLGLAYAVGGGGRGRRRDELAR